MGNEGWIADKGLKGALILSNDVPLSEAEKNYIVFDSHKEVYIIWIHIHHIFLYLIFVFCIF